MDTRFTVGQVVRATTGGVQGLHEGALYTVADRVTRHVLGNGYTHYELQPLDGGQSLRVSNGHLLLEAAVIPAKLQCAQRSLLLHADVIAAKLAERGYDRRTLDVVIETLGELAPAAEVRS